MGVPKHLTKHREIPQLRGETICLARDWSVLDLATSPDLDEWGTLYEPAERFYHHTGHVARMIEDFRRFFPDEPWDVYKAVSLFAIYHDRVFLPGLPPGLSEQYSAFAFARNFSRHWLQKDGSGSFWAPLIHGAILATARHVNDQDLMTSQAIMLDLDLVGLADPWEVYLATSAAIFRESQASEIGFLMSRVKFVTLMLDRRKIFYTEELVHLERPAMENLEMERETLMANQNRYLDMIRTKLREMAEVNEG